MKRLLLQPILTILSLVIASGSYGAILFDKSEWDFQQGSKVEQLDGEDIIHITSGRVKFKGRSIQNGIVEFDLFSEGERSFVYVYFREQSKQKSESVYLRTHKSNAPDTIQYSPVLQGRSSWQLYHGKKGSASAYLPANQWVKVKLEFRGNKLQVWIGEDVEPAMKNVHLSQTAIAGGISLRGFIPRASKASFSAKIKNVKVTPLSSETASDDKPATQETQDFISKIKVSSVFEATKSPIKALPETVVNGSWVDADAEYDGVVELFKWRDIPKGLRSWAAATAFTLVSPAAQQCMLNVGYSDAVTIHLNGKPIAFADASYRYDQNRQEGLLHANQLQVFLPLKKGQNNIVGIVADSFGGWGVRYSLENCDQKVQVEPTTTATKAQNVDEPSPS